MHALHTLRYAGCCVVQDGALSQLAQVVQPAVSMKASSRQQAQPAWLGELITDLLNSAFAIHHHVNTTERVLLVHMQTGSECRGGMHPVCMALR